MLPSRRTRAGLNRPGPSRGWARRLPAAALVILSLTAPWLSACSRHAPLALGPNQRPTMELTQAPTSTTQPFFYAYELRWAGFDVDGSVDHFRYAIDPPTQTSAETVWVSTTENRKSFLFRSDRVDSLTDKTAEGFHTIVMEAVDDRGAFSAPVSRSFTSFTVAPTVQITAPVPNHLLPPTFGPSFRISWKGTDPDGRTSNKPKKYKFRIFPRGGPEFDFNQIVVNPDSLRRRFAPSFAEWDSVGGDTTSADFTNINPRNDYILVVLAIDEVGAYSPVLNFDVNMLFFRVEYAGQLGPKFNVFNESFFFAYPSGGFSLEPGSFIRTEAPAGRPVHFGWNATSGSGSFVSGYRWMLDGNVNDQRERTNEDTDLFRWSHYSPFTTEVNLAPFNPGGASETHFLYIEAQDNNGLLSLAVVQFTVVRPIFDRELLFVDDTRLLGDRLLPTGCVDRPRGVWPTAAELDTFFFAHGHHPWRCYPTGTLSPVGLFQGYDYDTLGTRFLLGGTITLQQLGRYRHVVWYTDIKSALNSNPPAESQDPMSELRWLTEPGRSNPLGTWVSQGGELWMFGGGAATALQRNFEKSGTPSDVYSSTTGELGPGRFMFDVFAWKSEIAARSTTQAQMPSHPIGRSSDSPDYSGLPDYLFEKSRDTDAIDVFAPYRLSDSDFYQSVMLGEGLNKPNEILEDRDPDPNVLRQESVLDTLYEAVGGQLGTGKPIMTVWHGGTNHQRQVFSGFPLWYWRRDEQIAIADWVLQKLWGLPRRNVER